MSSYRYLTELSRAIVAGSARSFEQKKPRSEVIEAIVFIAILLSLPLSQALFNFLAKKMGILDTDSTKVSESGPEVIEGEFKVIENEPSRAALPGVTKVIKAVFAGLPLKKDRKNRRSKGLPWGKIFNSQAA